MLMPAVRLFALALLLVVCLAGGFASAADGIPLHQRIDEIISAKAGGPLAAQSSDEEFLRRVYLDLAGRVPSVEEARSFLASKDANKRAVLIDEILKSPDHVRRMTQVFHVMLMERLGDHEEWQKFLRESLAANKPWDQMCREILGPNADDEATRGSALWYTKRLENYGQNPIDVPGMVRDVGRHFMGIDVQCAQCHDHLFVDDYKQEFYHGLFAFVGRTQIRTDVKFPAVAVTPLDKKVEFMSVFVQKPLAVGPKLPGGPEVEIPADAKEFELPPDKKTKFPGVPKFNTLKVLSEQLPRAENELFTQNIANRLWWVMLGRGLVHPLGPACTKGIRPRIPRCWSCSPPSSPPTSSTSDGAARAGLDAGLSAVVPVRRCGRGRGLHRRAIRVALEKPLSSEQMLASVQQVLGDSQPLKIDLADKTWLEWQTKFDKALANPAREPEVEHSPTVKAALFLMHDANILQWLKPAGNNLAARLLNETDSAKLADELYLAVLCRRPAEDETKAVAEYLAARQSQPRGCREQLDLGLAGVERVLCESLISLRVCRERPPWRSVRLTVLVERAIRIESMNYKQLCTPTDHLLSRRQILGAAGAVGLGSLLQPAVAEEMKKKQSRCSSSGSTAA